MHCVSTSTSAGKHVNPQSHLSAINERLSLALESSHQIVFDWHIPDDRLYFSGELVDSFKGVLLDTAKTWSSSVLPAIIHNDDKENFHKRLHEALKGAASGNGGLYKVELRLKDAARAWRWVEISGKIVERDYNGRAVRMVGTFSDIDERKQAEYKIARLRDLYVALSQTNQAIVRIDERDALFREICRIAVEHGRFHMAWIGLVEHDSKRVIPTAAYGHSIDVLHTIDISIDESKPEGQGVIGTAIRENKPNICNDFFSAPNLQYCREAVAHAGFRSVASFPFQLSDRPLGVLNLYAAEKEFFDTGLIELLAEMTGDIAFAIENYERDAERKHAEALQLGQNQILNMVATGVSLPEILTEIALFAENRSGRGLCSIMQINNEGTTLGERVAPSLPPAYRMQVREAAVGPRNCSCGTAVFRAQPVTVADIENDPLWAAQCRCALAHGLRACSSWPIFGRNKKMLGTFALYFRETVAPSPRELQLFGICTNLAGIAIESRASEERIRYLAHYDGLTSLPNRFLFKEYLELALRNAQRNGKKFAVFFLDLDKFKEVNDTLGHDAGDQVLREIAKRLCGSLRDTDKIARMGGDEFYVLIEELSNGRYAADVAQKLLAEASRPVRIGERECRLSVSIGISIYPDDGSDGQMLLGNADSAMYRAKERGKNAYQFHSSHEEHDGKGRRIFRPHLQVRHQDADSIRIV